MTQPPSNQPPGGFGAPDPNPGANVPPVPPMPPQAPPAPPVPPQAPPAAPPSPHQAPPAQPGPYGYPQQAPQQPGPYGYPQQAPQQPGPYGYPQQPGPYGQQPGPYGSYPTTPMPPAPGGGGKNPFKGKPGLVVGAAVAAALVIGLGTWFVVGGDDEKEPVAQPTNSATTGPKPTASVDKGDGSGDGENGGPEDLNAGRKDGEAKISWLLKNDVDLPRNGADVYGPWIVGDTVVKAMYKGIDGYSLADGSPKWHIDVPNELCAAPPAPSANGLMVFGYKDSAGDRAKCLEMQQVDLNTGKAGWKKSIPKPTGLFAFSDNTLAIGGNTVTASGSSSAYGFSLTDGKQLFTGPTSGCKPYAYAGGSSKLIAASKCPSGDVSKEQHEISEVDPNTGKAKWSFKLQATWEVDKVYSVDPLVVSATQREQKKWAIFSLTAAGKERSQIQGGSDKFAPRCGGTFVIFGKNLQGCTGVAADQNTFYMATDTEYGTPNEVIAYDLNTGKPKWRSKAPGEQTMTPLRMEGSEVLLYVEPRYDTGGAVATLAPTGGAPKTLLQHQAAVSSLESSFYSARYAYSNGSFVIAAGRVSASNDKAEKETKTMMAYGK